MFKKLLLAAGLLLSFQSVAETQVWHMGTVESVYPQNNGNFIIILKDETPDCDGYFNVTVGQAGVTQEASEKMMSVALAAGMSGKELRVNFDKDSTSCFVNRMKIQF